MKEIVIGLRLNREAGISFFGIDEVNEALRSGKKIVSLENGNALFQKAGEDKANVRLVLSGFSIKVVMSD